MGFWVHLIKVYSDRAFLEQEIFKISGSVFNEHFIDSDVDLNQRVMDKILEEERR